MAKVVILGKALVVTSEAKLADIKTVLKYRPTALNLYADEEKTDLTFMVKVAGDGDGGSLGDCVVKFANSTTDAEGKAQITMTVGVYESSDEMKEVITDQLGTGLTKLAKVEAAIADIVAEIKAERDAVKAQITLA